MTAPTSPLYSRKHRTVTTTIERHTALGAVEVRSLPGGRAQARGYAATFGTLSQDLGGFVEEIAPGAFAEVLNTDDVVALFNHEADHVLGRKSAGTLRLWEDAKGLRYEVDLPDTATGRDVATLLERRDIIGSSFSFSVAAKGDRWGYSSGRRHRTITKVATLRDVGPVTFPAYLSTEATRSMAATLAPPAAGMSDTLRGEVAYLQRRDARAARGRNSTDQRAARLATLEAESEALARRIAGL